MTTRKNELEVEVLALPTEDRADLARRLIESLEESGVGEFEAEWIEERRAKVQARELALVLGKTFGK